MPKVKSNLSGTKHSNATLAQNKRNQTISLRKYKQEVKLKNTAFLFILRRGLLQEYRDFYKTHKPRNPHKCCRAWLKLEASGALNNINKIK